MIIVDFSQVFLSNLMVSAGSHADLIEPDLIRHMVLNSLRGYRQKFSNQYGELVIACDGKQCWRKDVYPQYKAHRKTDRASSHLDWPKILNTLDTIRNEIREYFPYPVIHLDRVEADDIIGTLVENTRNEKILILSGDRDFIQLQQFNNVEQYDPVRKKKVKSADAKRDLYEKILKGDRGDGVPNILSADETYVEKIRSKPLRSTRLNEWLEDPNLYMNPEAVFDEELYKNFKRNQTMVDLSYIPVKYKKAILEEYEHQEQRSGDRSKMFGYMHKKKLKNLMSQINDF
jgi:hypothetical protein